MYLTVAEEFYSIQGEGKTAGVPSVFLRLTGCNLTCKGWATKENPHGCDTTEVWRKGTSERIDTILSRWNDKGWFTLFKGGAHLIVTGGEPLLQMARLVEFFEMLHIVSKKALARSRVELETNGTIMPSFKLDGFIGQYNVSPKLTSNGDPRERAHKPEVLSWHAKCSRSNFKIVVCTPSDLDEVLEMVCDFQIPKGRVWLMPEGATRAALQSKVAWVAEACKECGFNYSSRLQIDIWEKATGV